ncbi:hypothetical protein B0H14DRAFT_2595878 [Mycena olivaceomarginata]|nr:hypothetical protein B0H14DRAFT_2595878 [Mycena olivaceomarginata]
MKRTITLLRKVLVTAANLDPTFPTHNSPAPGAKATTYGREHIYEIQLSMTDTCFRLEKALNVSLVSDLMSNLATQTSLRQPVNNNFCIWLTNEVVHKGMLQNLLHCFPYNTRITGSNPFMPWLEPVVNGIKVCFGIPDGLLPILIHDDRRTRFTNCDFKPANQYFGCLLGPGAIFCPNRDKKSNSTLAVTRYVNRTKSGTLDDKRLRAAFDV